MKKTTTEERMGLEDRAFFLLLVLLFLCLPAMLLEDMGIVVWSGHMYEWIQAAASWFQGVLY